MMRYMRQLGGNVIGVWLMAALVACGATPGAGATLNGTAWVLIKLNGSDPIAGTKITLSFKGQQATGSGGCNSYGGSYTASADTIRFSEVASTAMACTTPRGVNEQETAYYAALNNAATYRIVEGRLEIKDGADQTTLVFVAQS